MATIFCFDKCNVGIAQDFLASSGEDANERVIGCVQDEGGYGDTVHNMCGCSAIVVIRGAREPAIVSGDFVVKIAQTADTTSSRNFERARKQTGFGAEPAIQLPQEIVLIQTIAPQVEGVSRRREIHGRADRRYGTKLCRAGISPFAG